MNAQLKPITVQPLLRPEYDNTRITQCTSWLRDNMPSLLAYWACLGGDDKGLDAFARWLQITHDIELMRYRDAQS